MKNPDPNLLEDLNTDQHSVAAWIAKSLIQRGVRRIFGLQGGHIQPIWDFLAQQGVRYTNVYTTAGVCAPSRAALLMGQHQISFAGMHMRTTTGPLGEYLARPPAGLKAFPELLRQGGYFTFTNGKLDYQFSGVRAGSGACPRCTSPWRPSGGRARAAVAGPPAARARAA